MYEKYSEGSSPPAETATTEIEITLLDKHGEPFSKTIEYVDGTLVQTGGSQGLKFGKAYLLRYIGLTGHAQLLTRIAGNQALALGVFEGGENIAERSVHAFLPPVRAPRGAVTVATVVMHKQLELHRQAGTTAGLISRTADCLKYAKNRPVLVNFDTDLKGGPPEWSVHFAANPEVVWDCLCQACPNLTGAGHVIRRSTSAGLSHPATGTRFPSSGGTHCYALVRDGSDVPRALNALHERLWLCGYGWGLVTEAGGISARSLVDTCVGTGDRVAFEASPVLLGGLAQDATARAPMVVEGTIIDTKTAIPDLTAAERVRYEELWAAEQTRLADASAAARNAWVMKRAQKVSAETGIDIATCITALERSSQMKANRPTAERPYAWSAELLPCVELLFRDPALAGGTVADVLSDPLRFKGLELADPHGGEDYDPRRDKAIVVWPHHGKPYIDSRAHGGGIYVLVDDAPGWTMADVRARQSRALFAAAAPIEEDPNAPPPPKRRRCTPTTRVGRYTAQTRRLAQSLLCQRVPDDALLSLLHKQNNARDYPLLPREVDQIAFAAARIQWTKSNV